MTGSMLSLVLEAPGRLAWREDPPPEPASGEALVSPVCVGICGTDLHAFAGRHPAITYPRRLGHELAVRVVAAEGLASGALCAVNPYMSCGNCAACRRGMTNCCETLEVLGIHRDGGCTAQMALPVSQLYPSRILSAEELALVEPLVVGRHAVVRAGIEPEEAVAVVGLGPIGLAVAIFARERGAALALVDARQDRRRAARRLLDTDRVYAPGDRLASRLRSCFGGELPRVVIDATGSARGMRESYFLAGPAGRMVLVGIISEDFSFPDPDFHRRELSILASRNGTAKDFRHVLASLEAGLPAAAKLITHRYAFQDIPQAFGALADKPGLVKAVIGME